MIKQYILTVTADDVESKYPNFRFNYANKTEFIHMLLTEIEHMGRDEQGNPSYGYTMTVSEMK
jgi:hypothetical protein